MADATYTLSIPSTSAANGGTILIQGTAASIDPQRLPREMPPSIPSDQAYYWSFAWQRDIREAMDALRAGEYEDFDDPSDPNDIVRWFLSEES